MRHGLATNLRTMWLVFDSGDHEIGQMTKLMSNDVQKPVLVIDYFFGKFNGRMMLVLDTGCAICVLSFGRLASPVSTASRGIQSLAPNKMHTTCKQMGRRVSICLINRTVL